MEVLTDAELECLLEVPTSLDEARQIKKRNLAIIARLEKRKEGNVMVGCPHCQAAGGNRRHLGECSECKYPFLDSLNDQEHRCAEYTFGGFSLHEVSSVVSLQADRAEICTKWCKEETIANAIVWARGHVEWAEAVIAQKTKRRKK